MTDDVQEDTVIVFSDGAIGDELGNDWGVAVDLVLKERVEVLVIGMVRHDNQEDELGVLDGAV